MPKPQTRTLTPIPVLRCLPQKYHISCVCIPGRPTLFSGSPGPITDLFTMDVLLSRDVHHSF